MLGRFLEFSVATADIAGSFEFYRLLGLTQVPTGDAWPHPYAVLTDGRIHVGLHGGEDAAPQLTFVRPQLLQAADALERQGHEFTTRRLGSEQFNELGLSDPDGNQLRLLEARTYSPATQALEASLCGHFLEVALPVSDPDAARTWWEQLGFVGLDEPEARLPHICCVSDTLNVGLYERAAISAPTLLFEVEDLPALRTRLTTLGIAPLRTLPQPLRAQEALLISAPEGTPLLLYGAGAG